MHTLNLASYSVQGQKGSKPAPKSHRTNRDSRQHLDFFHPDNRGAFCRFCIRDYVSHWDEYGGG